MFCDRVKVKFVGGKGGNGVVTWRREKYLPKGGPTGGNGGVGGNVVLKVEPYVHALDWFRYRKILKAEDGQVGGANQARGRNGKDLVLKVPRGTLVKDMHTGEILADLTELDKEWVLCEGGRGGKGNACFATPTNRAPNYATPGKPGVEKEIELELKLIADIGLVGFPNAGKSTLINALSRVKVKVAPYPFTTLKPNLGIIRYDDFSQILLADIPGIIAGASENKGLGFEFLRHVERTKALVFVLDASGIDGRTPVEDYETLLEELKAYNPEMAAKPSLVILNKTDSEKAEENIAEFLERHGDREGQIFQMSAQQEVGLQPFLLEIHGLIHGKREGGREVQPIAKA